MNPILGHLIEAVISIALIMSFFTGLQLFLNMVFPSDAGLGALIAGMRSPDPGAEALTDDQRLQSEGLGEERPVAELTSVRNDVMTRRGNNLAWGSARRGMRLHNRDAVQTRGRSAASIAFRGSGLLNLGSNTHVIISSNDSDIFSRSARSSVFMFDGQLRGRLIARSGSPGQLEVTLPNGGTTRISSDSGDGEDVEFRIQVNPDSSAVVAMETGTAEVIANGDTIAVKSAEFTTIGAGATASHPKQLDKPILTVSPANGEVFNFRNLSPQVEFKWETSKEFSSYRVLVAKDVDFNDIVHDEVVEGSHLTHGNLSAGTYYWQVHGIKDGFEVTLNSTQTIHLSQSNDPPRLDVRFPEGAVSSAVFDLKGRTERGTRVLVGGKEAHVDARGHFSFQLDLKPGLNVVVVEAIDKLGNVSYQSQVINSKP